MVLDSYNNLKNNDIDIQKLLDENSEYDRDNMDVDYNNKRYTENDLEIMKKIVRKLITYNSMHKTLSRYEYFMMGGMPFNEAASLIYFMHLDGKFRNLEYAALKKYISVQQNVNSSKRYDFIMMTHYQFGEYVISETEKEYIWNELKKDIDEKNIDDLVFSGAVRAYAIEKGLIIVNKNNSGKRLVKKINNL